jgi:hypothetical protein
MSIQKFSLETLKKVRHHLQTSLSLANTEKQPTTWAKLDENNDLPEPESLEDLSGIFTFGGISEEDIAQPHSRDRWFVSTVNPGDALLKLPGLSVKPAFRLVSYLYRDEAEGVGLVFAVPQAFSTTACLEAALKQSGDLDSPPQPQQALSQFMEAIDGDRSPLSFLFASLVRRELQEFGATGKRCQWSHHQFINALPPHANYQWRVNPPPQDFSPKVKVFPDGQAAVEFFTYRVGKPIVLYRHLDQYPVHQYRANSFDKPIGFVQKS